jgi:hypothetical protein
MGQQIVTNRSGLIQRLAGEAADVIPLLSEIFSVGAGADLVFLQPEIYFFIVNIPLNRPDRIAYEWVVQRRVFKASGPGKKLRPQNDSPKPLRFGTFRLI